MASSTTRSGAKPESVQRAKTFLVKAIANNDLKTLKKILDAKYPVEEPIQAYGNQTPLMYAASVGQPEVLELILNHKADMTATDNAGRTVFHYCCRGGNIQNFRVLKQHIGNNLGLYEQRTCGGVTPLMFAIQSANKYMVGECLNSSFDPFARDFSGKSSLQYAYPFKHGGDQSIYQLIQTAQTQWRAQLPAADVAKREQAPDHSAYFDIFFQDIEQVQQEQIQEAQAAQNNQSESSSKTTTPSQPAQSTEESKEQTSATQEDTDMKE